MRMREAERAQRRMLCGYLLAGAAIAVAFLLGDGQVQTMSLAASTLLPLAAVLVGLRRWSHDRGFPLAVGAGMALMSVEHVRRVQLHMGHATNGDGVSAVLAGLTYLALLGICALVVLRHAPRDKGGVIDAAVTGIAGAGLLWEFVMLPSLHAHNASSGDRVTLLVEVFALLALVGGLGRISATVVQARFSLRALYAAVTTAVLGFVASVVTTESVTNTRAGWITLVWIVCYLSLGASVLHPNASSLATPEGYREPVLTFGKLAALGAVLTVLPLAGSAPQFVGRPADGVLISVGTLVAVPLVLLRIGQLIAQRAADQRTLAHLAAHDDLTGLPNRRTMMALLEKALGEGDVSVLYCDLDGFKPINDTYGHHAGDEVLRVVASRLRYCVRAGDTVGRLGGDEFLIICRRLAPDEARVLQQRIQQAIAEPIAWQGHLLSAGVTVGLASGAHGVAVDTLVGAADQKMYAGKRARVSAWRQSGRKDEVQDRSA